MTQDLDPNSSKISYLKARGRSFTSAVSLSEADFIEVNLFRKPILDEFVAMTANPDQGLVRSILGSGDNVTGIVNMEYSYFPVDYESKESYPLKSPAEAWKELAAGEGYVARVDLEAEKIVVRRLELGYFDSYSPQEYLQPIYIFRGDDDFVGYVPALADVSYNRLPAK